MGHKNYKINGVKNKFNNFNFGKYLDQTSLDDNANYCQDKGDWMVIKNIYIYKIKKNRYSERAKRKKEWWNSSTTLELMADTFSIANKIERGNGKSRANQSIRQLE